MVGTTMVKLLHTLDQGSPQVAGGFGGGLGLYVLGLTSHSGIMKLARLGSDSLCHQVLVSVSSLPCL